MRATNAAHATIRARVVAPEARARWAAELGAERVDAIMAAGLAGISPGRDDDIKCCHAQLADWLLRARDAAPGAASADDDASTRVGAEVARVLRERGVDLSGCGACREQCAGCGASAEDAGAPAWSYTPVKNKMKLRTHSKNRRIEREKKRQRQQRAEQSPAP